MSATRQTQVVPIIDISRFRKGTARQRRAIARKVDRACTEIGFLVITGHDIPTKVIEAAWTETSKYFDLPVIDKRRIPMTPVYPYGYSGFKEETLSKSLKKELPPDLKESFCVGPYKYAAKTPKTVWPKKPKAFRTAWLAYYKAMEDLSATLLEVFAIALGLPDGWFDDKIDHHASAMRALNYPLLTKTPKKSQLRASPHTDYGSLTILKSGGRGLQVRTRNGAWVDVPHLPNSFIVNLGDLMANWTNDRWVSTLHRVIAPTLDAQERRQSIAFFHNVNADAIIECIETCCSDENPAKYPPITAGEHLMRKHSAATTGGRKKRGSY